MAIIDIDEFVLLIGSVPVLDVRSESEYGHGHVPGAVNLPLLSDSERAIVGTVYKKEGREAAVKKGFELVGPRFSSIIEEAGTLFPGRQVAMYCWRGGMRSNIMAWLLEMSGFRVSLLNGGYKTWRHWVLERFEIPKNLIVIGGRTGSGKTALLHALKNTGEQVIDLEGMAHHKGSAFGALGQKPQHTNEHFENLLALQWHECSPYRITWIENESRSVGSNIIPIGIYSRMREAYVAEVILDAETRKKRILNEYGRFPVDILSANTVKVAKRLGGLRLKEALDCLEAGDLYGWVGIMMHYYDDTYDHSNRQRDRDKVVSIPLSDDNMDMQALHVMDVMKEAAAIRIYQKEI